MAIKMTCDYCHEPISHQDIVFCSNCWTGHNGLARDTREQNKSLKGANDILQQKLKAALHEVADLKRQRDETLAGMRDRDKTIAEYREKYEPITEILK